MHTTVGTFMRNESSIAGAIAIRYRAAKNPLDQIPLMIIEPLGRAEYYSESTISEAHTL